MAKRAAKVTAKSAAKANESKRGSTHSEWSEQTPEQREEIMRRAREAANAERDIAARTPLTEAVALAAVEMIADVLGLDGWGHDQIMLVLMWRGEVAGATPLDFGNPVLRLHGIESAPGTRSAIVANTTGARVLVQETADGTRTARVLARAFGLNGYRAIERADGSFDVYTHSLDMRLVASGLSESDARAMAGEA
ncbi:MAG: hypothetical protein U0269_37885 [Polyangiales bacterium]